mmetsp:Transcript_22777/g.23115  ORF Transcript_22777/g.23115 Transcript_22777/m.23115 type:complete len:84 (-) Transcript_22777:526-777(-)
MQTIVEIEGRMNLHQIVEDVESQVPPHTTEHPIFLPQKRPTMSQFTPSVEQHSLSSVAFEPYTVTPVTMERICQGTTSVSSIY